MQAVSASPQSSVLFSMFSTPTKSASVIAAVLSLTFIIRFVSPSQDGAILLVDRANPLGLSLNFSLIQFADSLLVASRFLRLTPADLARNSKRHVLNLQRELMRIDRAAFNAKDSCWADWIQELRSMISA